MPARVLARFAAVGVLEVVVELIVAVTTSAGCGSEPSWTAASTGWA
jgi:hypothetical protein